MRVFPVDLNQVLSMEIDIEYSGGIILDIETRLKVCELELQKDLIKTSLESNSTYELNSDFLEGIEHYGNQLKSPSNSATGMGNRNEVDKAGESNVLQVKYLFVLIECCSMLNYRNVFLIWETKRSQCQAHCHFTPCILLYE